MFQILTLLQFDHFERNFLELPRNISSRLIQLRFFVLWNVTLHISWITLLRLPKRIKFLVIYYTCVVALGNLYICLVESEFECGEGMGCYEDVFGSAYHESGWRHAGESEPEGILRGFREWDCACVQSICDLAMVSVRGA